MVGKGGAEMEEAIYCEESRLASGVGKGVSVVGFHQGWELFETFMERDVEVRKLLADGTTCCGRNVGIRIE